jgi:RimJ/RimL family protein N-acetyltransferase
MNGDVRIRTIGRPQRDLLVEMYDRFEPLGAALGIPPVEEERRREWAQSALSHEMNLAAFLPTGAVIGHCFLVVEKTGSAELAVFVRQEYRRRGVAAALVKTVLEWGTVEGLRRVWTLTGSENTPALRLQAKFGFRPTHYAPSAIELEIHLPGVQMTAVRDAPAPGTGFSRPVNPRGIMDCIRHAERRDRYADVDSGPALFRTATDQESRIHVNGRDFTGPRHWSDYGGIQRDLCRAD